MANFALSRTLSRKGSRALSRKPSDKESWFESLSLIDNTKSLAFDGTNDYALVSHNSDIALAGSAATFSAWIKLDGLSNGDQKVMSKALDSSNPGLSAYQFRVNGDDILFQIYSGDWRTVSASNLFTDLNWTHVAITIDSGDFVKIYKNGTEVQSTHLGYSIPANTADLVIGARNASSPGEFFQGKLDELAIWNTDLDGDAVAAIYNSGVPTDLSQDSGSYDNSSALKAWWRMGDKTEPVADGSGWNTNNKFVFDQIGTSLDSEMVILDAYNSDNWYVYSGNTMTFGDNFMRCERTASGSSNGWFTYLRGFDEANSILFSTPTNDSFCLLTFDVETDDPDAYVFLRINNTSSYYLQGTGNGTKTIVYKKDSYTDYLEGRSLSQGKYMKISNVSVKKIVRTLGEELLTGFTNGSTYPFDTFSSSGTSITSAIETSGNWGGAASNSFNISSGKVYKVTFDLTYNSGSDTLRVVFADNANGGATQRSDIYYTNSNGVNTTYLTAAATDATAHLQIGTWHSSDVVNFSASNISVKEVSVSTVAEMTNMDSGDIVQYAPNSYILSDLGITPRIAVSMTRKLVSDYSGDLYATSGSGPAEVTTVYDQSGNGTNLTNDSTTNATLSGSGNSARAVFASSGYTALTTSTTGSSFDAGTYDIFIVFDPITTNKQMLFSRGSTGADRIAMESGSSSDVFSGVTSGDVRVNDVVLSSQTRGALYTAATVAGMNVISVQDLDLNTMDGNVMLGVKNTTWRAEGHFAEFIVTPSLTDAEHSAVVENIRAHYAS